MEIEQLRWSVNALSYTFRNFVHNLYTITFELNPCEKAANSFDVAISTAIILQKTGLAGVSVFTLCKRLCQRILLVNVLDFYSFFCYNKVEEL